jgi:predicted metal-dependent hydrolase
MVRRSLTVGKVSYPVEIHVESRRNVRASIGKKAVYIRVPRHLSRYDRDRHIEKMMRWAARALEKRPGSLADGRRGFRDGETFLLDGRRYRLRIEVADRKTAVGRLKGRTLTVLLPATVDPSQRDRRVAQAASRCIASLRLPELEETIGRLNRRYFDRPIGRIRFKYNRSNWGSCSAKGNINISTRLLFAPRDVLEYVCVHELAHLAEMNHSARFWSLVERAVPDYRAKVEWLKANGDRLWF